ncbi:MAG: hypothetical protein NTX28_07930 [Novosphingobium sp.]|nr:hypothetical protein [Novosphingobium sp.]
MMIRAGTGWQYALADLSLILFVPAPAPVPVAAALDSEPVAVWSAEQGAPPLAGWLAQVGNDPRMEVRIVVRYTEGRRAAAVGQAMDLAQAGGARAQQARILVEPGARDGAIVSLYYASERPAGNATSLAR